MTDKFTLEDIRRAVETLKANEAPHPYGRYWAGATDAELAAMDVHERSGTAFADAYLQVFGCEPPIEV